MKYVEWVAHVLGVTVELNVEADPGHMVGLREITARLSTAVEGATPQELDGAAWTAIEDLDALGLVDIDSIYIVRITQEARKTRHGGSLRDLWPTLARRFLEPEQESFLRETVRRAERIEQTWADVDWVSAEDVVSGLGWPDDIHVRYTMPAALEGEGLAKVQAAMGGYVRLRPTYAGVVRATEALQAEWHERLAALVARGETANVEFKRELHLEHDREKAEFVRDILALANTNVSGPLTLVIGFDPKTLRFAVPVDPSITQDRIEDILNAWTKMAPATRWNSVETPDGTAGLLEVNPEPRWLPYVPARGFGKTLAIDQVFVRHGSHVETPSADERADLDTRRERAALAELRD